MAESQKIPNKNSLMYPACLQELSLCDCQRKLTMLASMMDYISGVFPSQHASLFLYHQSERMCAMFDIAKVFGKGVAEATIREITGHMFDHFLAALIALVAAGKISLDEVLQLSILVALVVLIVKVAHLKCDEIDGQEVVTKPTK
jgi:hypothetical protein